MTRPYRHEPPEVGDSVLRVDVLGKLLRRFDARVTVVRAGAGFGKTTAIAQAIKQNELAPRGIDVWMACNQQDGERLHLLDGLMASIHQQGRLADETPASVNDVNEAIAAMAPTPVCLCLDDADQIAPDSDGISLLDELIEALPANGHLLLATRHRVSLRLARLRTQDSVIDIDESGLAFDDIEIAQLATLRGVDAEGASSLNALAGWPALLALSIRGEEPRAYIDEEVLEELSDNQRRLLHALAVLGETDRSTLEFVAEASSDELSELPLVRRADGKFAIHDVWNDLLGDSATTRILIQRSVEGLVETNPASAVDVAVRSGAGDEWRPVLVRALRNAMVRQLPTPATLRRWNDTLDITGAATEFLAGSVLQLDDPTGGDCRASFERAADGFRIDGDDDGLATALNALIYVHHVRRDVGSLLPVIGQLLELADRGVPGAMPVRGISASFLALGSGDHQTVIDTMKPVLNLEMSATTRATALWLYANGLYHRGYSSVDVARRCLSIGVHVVGLQTALTGALWKDARIDEALAIDRPSDGDREVYLWATWRAIILAAIGDLDEAERMYALAEATCVDPDAVINAAGLSTARAGIAHERGHDDDAGAELESFVASHDPIGPLAGWFLTAIGHLYRRNPGLRAHFDAVEGGPLYERDRRHAQLFTIAVESDDWTELASFRFTDDPAQIIPALGIRSTCELLAACSAAGNDDADRMIGWMFGNHGNASRRAFRLLTEHANHRIAQAARQAIEVVPVRSARTLDVALLGDAELLADGRPIESPDWRRERVRALLTYLIFHPDASRDEVLAVLWPDKDAAAGRKNLRTTLNMLHHVLEPERHSGEAPFFVQSIGQRFRLQRGDRMQVDVMAFERLLDEATELESRGAPSAAIEPLRTAVRLYRGDLLADTYDDWVVFARDRLRARFLTGSVRCAELLIASDGVDEATSIAGRALEIEPWSEPAHRVLISAHLARNDVASARRALATCESSLSDLGGPTDELTVLLAERVALGL